MRQACSGRTSKSGLRYGQSLALPGIRLTRMGMKSRLRKPRQGSTFRRTGSSKRSMPICSGSYERGRTPRWTRRWLSLMVLVSQQDLPLTGPGINDLLILGEGSVAGEWEVAISSLAKTVRIQQNNPRSRVARIESYLFYTGTDNAMDPNAMFTAYAPKTWNDYPNDSFAIAPEFKVYRGQTYQFTHLCASITFTQYPVIQSGAEADSCTYYYANMDYRYNLDYPNGTWNSYSQIPASLIVNIPGTTVTHTWSVSQAKEGQYAGSVYDYIYPYGQVPLPLPG
jgi:hypothetical protein